MTVPLPRIRRAGGKTPRVLLVDDHAAVLDRVSAALADSFDIVGVATDSRQVVAIARRLDPDAIVLDINMPGLDGFATMRALEHAASRAAVVFLSLLDDPEYISEAFRLGASGYVLKPRMISDLPMALDQVIHGRRLLPSLAALHSLGANEHAVHPYSDEAAFADALVTYFDMALQRGGATCLIATASIRERVTRQLQTRVWNASDLRRYRVIDTHTALANFMRGDEPDAARLVQVIEELDTYRRTVCDASSAGLTIAGNLSGVLCAAGNPAGALAIEQLWNTLAAGRPFLTVCGYQTSCFHDHDSDGWQMTADEHSAVCHSSDV